MTELHNVADQMRGRTDDQRASEAVDKSVDGGLIAVIR